MSEEVSKTESGLSEKDQKILSMLTPGERIILERLLELHPSDKAFDLFEMMNGTISDERFSSMSKSYEDEQTQLKQEADALRQEIAQQEQHANDVGRFVALAHKYFGLEELTPYALHELVKAIYIEDQDESDGKRRQSIHISYDFVGFIPIQELMQEEMA